MILTKIGVPGVTDCLTPISNGGAVTIFSRKDFLDNVTIFAESGEKDSTKIFDLHAEMANKKIEWLERKTDGWYIKSLEEERDKWAANRLLLMEKIQSLERLLKHQGELLDATLNPPSPSPNPKT